MGYVRPKTKIINYEMKTIDKCELLKKVGFSYDPATGEFTTPLYNVIKGISNGYYMCNYYNEGKIITIQAHIFAYYLMKGELPTNVDHKNRNKLDNRWCNLRNVTHQENQFNTKAKGYTYHRPTNKYKAQIGIDKTNKYLGYYNTKEEAHQAYLEAKEKLHIIK